ncbi:ATP-binding protein [Streptomyces sp. NPDC093085]|uniref:ATP-binding protein n=1 Tax=Streptomyces sp. NPDC093085 TaxID=3155068 RepID=UPI00343EC21B
MKTESVEAVSVAREWSLHYTMVPGSVHLARIHVRRHVTGMGWRGDVEEAVLIASELVSNSVVHARVPGELLTLSAAVLNNGGLLLDVSDPVGAFHCVDAVAEQRVDAESGRGLVIVRGLGAHLSWFLREGGGKTVRAYVPAVAPVRGSW